MRAPPITRLPVATVPAAGFVIWSRRRRRLSYILEMTQDFFHTERSDPIGEFPPDKLERAMVLRNGLVALCGQDSDQYNCNYSPWVIASVPA